MDLPELLRSQARRYSCSACGQNMADCGINVLAQQGNRALVRVTCAACRDENLLQIIFQTEGDFTDDARELAPIPVPPAFDEGVPENLHPITADELLDLHDFLEGFNSGLADLVRPSA